MAETFAKLSFLLTIRALIKSRSYYTERNRRYKIRPNRKLRLARKLRKYILNVYLEKGLRFVQNGPLPTKLLR